MRHFSIQATALMFLLCGAVYAQQNPLVQRNSSSDPCSRFKMQIVVPSDEVDFKLGIVKPPEGVDFKMRLINPCPAALPQLVSTLPVITQREKGSFFAPKPFQFGLAPKSDREHQALDFLSKPNVPLMPTLKQK